MSAKGNEKVAENTVQIMGKKNYQSAKEPPCLQASSGQNSTSIIYTTA